MHVLHSSYPKHVLFAKNIPTRSHSQLSWNEPVTAPPTGVDPAGSAIIYIQPVERQATVTMRRATVM